MIRAVIVDDLATVRQAIRRMLADDGIAVVAEGRDGAEAVALVAEHRPDIVLMDVDMPRMDGLAATQEIMATCATRILIVTSSTIMDRRHLPFAAIEAGALDVFPKPDLADPEERERAAQRLRQTVRMLARVPVVRRRRQRTVQPTARRRRDFVPGWRPSVVVVGASTGGPMVVRSLLGCLTPGFPAPIVVVQHIGHEFVPGLVEWLGQQSPLPVAIAQDRMPLRPGTITIAGGGVHLRVAEGPICRFDNGPPVNHCRPSVDVLFHSAATAFHAAVIGIILTGMGRDGAEGVAAIRIAGGITVAQDKASSTVYGMPAAAMELGGVDHVGAPAEIGRWLSRLAE